MINIQYVKKIISILEEFLISEEEDYDEIILMHSLLGLGMIYLNISQDHYDELNFNEVIKIIDKFIDNDDDLKKNAFISKSLILINLDNSHPLKIAFFNYIIENITNDPFNCVLSSLLLSFEHPEIDLFCINNLSNNDIDQITHLLSIIYLMKSFKKTNNSNYISKIFEIFNINNDQEVNFNNSLIFYSQLIIACILTEKFQHIPQISELLSSLYNSISNLNKDFTEWSIPIIALGLISTIYIEIKDLKNVKKISDLLSNLMNYEDYQTSMDATTWIGIITFYIRLLNSDDLNIYKTNFKLLENNLTQSSIDSTWSSALFLPLLASISYSPDQFFSYIQSLHQTKNEVIYRGSLIGLGLAALVSNNLNFKKNIIKIIKQYGSKLGLIFHKYSEYFGIALAYSRSFRNHENDKIYIDIIFDQDPFVSKSGIIGAALSILLNNDTLSDPLKNIFPILSIIELLYGYYEIGLSLFIIFLIYR
ncbi:MAG: hypothetical protein ACTSPY_04690 [Candidatus Helarchaeota archaeon]